VEETREKVDVAIEQLDRGEGINGEVVISQLRERNKQKAHPQKSSYYQVTKI
jgi:antitoxin ParD1/3/4